MSSQSGRERSHSVSTSDFRISPSTGGSPGPNASNEGAADLLLAFEDITLREHYKTTESMFDNLLHVRAEFKKLLKTLQAMQRHLTAFHENASLLSEQLEHFSFRSGTDDSGDAIMQVCGSQFLRLSQIQVSVANQMRDVVITPMEKFLKEDLNADILKEKCRVVNTKRDSYNAAHRTKEKAEKKKKDAMATETTSKKTQDAIKKSATAMTDLTSIRKDFQTANGEFQRYLREILAISRFDFTQRLAAFVYAHKSYYQQGMGVFDYFGDDLLSVMTEMEDARKEFVANKDKEDHRISIFVSQTQTSGLYKQGYLYKQSHNVVKSKVKGWSMRWFVLKDGCLLWYENWKDRQPSGSLKLHICRLKQLLDKPLCFEVLQAAPEVRVTVRALTDNDYKSWCEVLNNAIAYALSKYQDDPASYESGLNAVVGGDMEASTANDVSPEAQNPGDLDLSYLPSANSILQRLREKDPSNNTCADCGAEAPDWASINIGAVVCIDCSGIHRSLGTHISKVRSLHMDVLKPVVEDYLLEIGNKYLNSILEATTFLNNATKPAPGSDRSTKQKYITAKYTEHKFLTSPGSKTKETIQESLNQAIISNSTDMRQLMVLVANGASANFQISAEAGNLYSHLLPPNASSFKVHVLHLAAKNLNLKQISFLLLNGARIEVTDVPYGRTPAFYAALGGSLDCLYALLSTPADAIIKDGDGKSMLDLCFSKLAAMEVNSLNGNAGDDITQQEEKAKEGLRSVIKFLTSAQDAANAAASSLPPINTEAHPATKKATEVPNQKDTTPAAAISKKKSMTASFRPKNSKPSITAVFGKNESDNSSSTTDGPVIIGGSSGDALVAVPHAKPLNANDKPNATNANAENIEISRPMGSKYASLSLRLKSKKSNAQFGDQKSGSMDLEDLDLKPVSAGRVASPYKRNVSPLTNTKSSENSFDAGSLTPPPIPPKKLRPAPSPPGRSLTLSEGVSAHSPTPLESPKGNLPELATTSILTSSAALDDSDTFPCSTPIAFGSIANSTLDDNLDESTSVYDPPINTSILHRAEDEGDSDQELQVALQSGEAALEALLASDSNHELKVSQSIQQENSQNDSMHKDKKQKKKSLNKEEVAAVAGASAPNATANASVPSEPEKSNKDSKKDKKKKDKDSDGHDSSKNDKEKEKKSRWPWSRSVSVLGFGKGKNEDKSSSSAQSTTSSLSTETSPSTTTELSPSSSQENVQASRSFWKSLDSEAKSKKETDSVSKTASSSFSSGSSATRTKLQRSNTMATSKATNAAPPQPVQSSDTSSSLSAVPAWKSQDFPSPVKQRGETKRFTRANKSNVSQDSNTPNP